MKVALLIPITSKERNWNNLFDTYFINYTLKTFLETKNNNITYGFYLGFDSDDPLFSRKEIIEQLQKIFMINNIHLNITKYNNIKKGHLTKMWNVLYKKAYDDNYDYFYQCGDDIQFMTQNWIVDSIYSLKNKNDIGVSGPNNIEPTNPILTQVMVSRKHMEIFGFFFPEPIENWYYDNWISDVYQPTYFTKLNQHYSPNLGGKVRYDIQRDKTHFLAELERGKKILEQYLNPTKKIIYIGFWPDHKLDSDHIYLNALKGQNYQIDKTNEINDDILSNYDVIICGSFLHNPDDVFVLSKYYDKVIYNITEPVEFNDKIMYKIYSKNLINLTVGCVKESGNHVKYPHYMDWGLSIDKMIEANNYVEQIKIEEIINKKFCCLINRHDMGKTRTDIYNKLKLIGHIDCPGNLFNNFSNELFEKKGRTNFQKEYLFSICPENFMTKNPGYVTEKLFMACITGTISIYWGDLDQIDKSIFNMNRVLLFDPTSESSINQVYYKILELTTNPNKLYEFYTQPIFNESAIQTYGLLIDNFKMRINNFINGKTYNQSLLTNESYEVERKEQTDKINGLDHIVWINLDRSSDRRVKMEKILEKINVPNTRIKAIDGVNEDMSPFNYLERPMTNYEKAVALSHIKAYSNLKNIPGNYFLVLEDDISLRNLKYFDYDLKSIIANAPDFDILQLQKTYHHPLDNLYSKWKKDIYSAVSYVISRKGLNKLLKLAEYDGINNKFNIYSPLSISDFFLYNSLETWVYKYNYLSTDDETSIIHPDHLDIHKQSSLVQLITIFNDLVLK